MINEQPLYQSPSVISGKDADDATIFPWRDALPVKPLDSDTDCVAQVEGVPEHIDAGG